MDQGIAQIMTAEVTCVDEGASLDDLRELLLERGLHCVPVVAPEGRPVGVVTQTDLLRTISQIEEGEGTEGGAAGEAGARLGVSPRSTGRMAAVRERTAGDIMTALVFALPVTASVEQAAALMAYEGVEQLVVTSLDGEVAGLVRALDVARSCARSAGYLVDREE
ncbi:MAG TPA: CBS domain-containing protein [Kofleriaceae bacterium]|nr:CBS domain-containing protein [Kofleriaceae bacterium]